MIDRAIEALAGAPIGVVIVDSEGHISFVNAVTEAIFGYTRQELAGQPLDQLIPARFRAQHDDYRRQYSVTPQTRPMGAGRDLYGLRKDGTEVPIEVGLSRTEIESEPVIVAFVSDITVRKRQEESLRLLNIELERRVAARTEQLEATVKDLESFSYSVSHDLRAPLRHIDGFVTQLQRREAGKLDATSAHYLDIIARAAGKLGCLIDELLTLTRIGRTEMRTTQVDLNGLFRDALELLEPEAGGRSITWRIDLLPRVEGDPLLLRTVLVNLVSNAIKYSSKREDARVEVKAVESSGTETTIAVRDNGVGFEPEYAGRLFGVFQRLHRDDEFPGTGIGLAVVKRILERHQGRIWAESEPGQGATFYFTLQLALQEEAPVHANGQSAAGGG